MRRYLVCEAAIVAACGGAGTTTSQHATTTVGDATYAVPEAWRVVRTEKDLVTCEDPDRALRVTIVATTGDAKAAIEQAWHRVEPTFALAGQLDEPPPTDGWDAMATIEYTTPTAAARAARALWRRHGRRGYVVLIEGERNAFDRRDAQIETIVSSLRPPGLYDERLTAAPRALDAHALDAFAEHALSTLGVPGAAIGVIVDGRVVYDRTLGVRELGETAPITPNTRFLIASTTKPMTTMMEGTLVDAGTLRWDTPVTTLLPSFALADDVTTRALQLWHMSCACTGMPRQDLEGLFEWDGVTPEARIAVMRTMKPTTKLGETFQYSNPMVAAGGYAAAHAFAPDRPLAEAYAAAMQAKIFGPIGMTSTTLDFATVERGEHAIPHALAIDGTTHAMPLAIERAVEPIAPAGGAWTTLHDLERYVQTELADGLAPDGKRVISAAAIRERRNMRVHSDETSGYGLGLGVGTYAGARYLSHDGGSFGFGTTMFMLPDRRIGIVILTNIRNGNAKEELPFNAAVKRRILELLFADARPLAEQQLAYYAKLRRHTPRAPSTDLTWVTALVGTYHNEVLGRVDIRATASGAELDAGEWRTAIDRVVEPDGTAKLVILDPPFAGGDLVVGPGAPPTLVIPGQTTYTFSR
jgi:CubicO group peptidase (beta-lactamase class C family)